MLALGPCRGVLGRGAGSLTARFQKYRAELLVEKLTLGEEGEKVPLLPPR